MSRCLTSSDCPLLFAYSRVEGVNAQRMHGKLSTVWVKITLCRLEESWKSILLLSLQNAGTKIILQYLLFTVHFLRVT